MTVCLPQRQMSRQDHEWRFLLAALFLVLASCSLPEVSVDRKHSHSNDTTTTPLSSASGSSEQSKFIDKNYLATVHVKLSNSSDAVPIKFDVTRNKRSFLTFVLWESDQAKSFVHLGYTSSDGLITGVQLRWHF